MHVVLINVSEWQEIQLEIRTLWSRYDRYKHVSACLPHVKLKVWHAHTLLHEILLCTWLPMNTCNARFLSQACTWLVILRIWCTDTVDMYICVDNKIHWFCNCATAVHFQVFINKTCLVSGKIISACWYYFATDKACLINEHLKMYCSCTVTKPMDFIVYTYVHIYCICTPYA